MFRRRTTGSVVCPSCGSLVGVRDDKCYMCGRANPGLWGFGPAFRQLGADFGFVPLVIGASLTLGASASICGLLGALVHYGRKSGSSLIHGQAMNYAVILFVMGLVFPGVDNSAHAGGFLGGYAMSAIFNPLTREKGDHLI